MKLVSLQYFLIPKNFKGADKMNFQSTEKPTIVRCSKAAAFEGRSLFVRSVKILLN